MRTLTVNYLGPGDVDHPYGDSYVEQYQYVIGYTFDPEDKTLVIEHYTNAKSDVRRTVIYPESKVIRATFSDTAAA